MQHNMILVEAHDTDSDHGVGGQDLPYLITAKYSGTYDDAKNAVRNDPGLNAFNVQPSDRLSLPKHIEFCTFEDYLPFFGLKPVWTVERELTAKYSQRSYVATVGELRKALEKLPDDFPIIHTGEQHNRLGVCVHTADYWHWTRPQGHPQWGEYKGWALRLDGFDPYNWKHIVEGTWKNCAHDGYDVLFSDMPVASNIKS